MSADLARLRMCTHCPRAMCAALAYDANGRPHVYFYCVACDRRPT